MAPASEVVVMAGTTSTVSSPDALWPESAPVAVTWLGYFATTGLAAIDYVLCNRWVIPEAEEGQWVERPWRLPETYLCFTPPKVAVPLGPPPLLAAG